MDNASLGRNNNVNNQVFFTPGPGEQVDKNDREPEDNINLSNQAASWSNKDSAKRAGDIAMNGAAQEKELTKQETLGEIVYADSNQAAFLHREAPAPDGDHISKIINFGDFSAKGDKISKETLSKITHVVDEYKAGKISPIALDDAEWEGTKAYVKASFGRNLAA